MIASGRLVPSTILKSFRLISKEAVLLQTNWKLLESSQTCVSMKLQNVAPSPIFRSYSQLSSSSISSLSQLSEVVSQLLSMQGRTVGGLKDKVVVGTITQEKAAQQFCQLYSNP